MEKKHFFKLTHPEPQSTEGCRAESQGRKLEAGTEGEAMDECYYWLVHSWLDQPTFLYIPPFSHLTKAWHLSQWIGPFHINPKPRKFPQDSRTEAFSGLHTLFSDNYSFCQIEGKKTARADWKYLSPCNKKLWMTFTKLLKATMFLHLCKNSNECEHFIFLSHVDQSVAAFPTLITLLGWNKNPSAH